MNAALVVLLFAAAASAAVPPQKPLLGLDELQSLIKHEHNMLWTDFKAAHSKQYETPAEELYRRMVWEQNLAYIEQHNKEAEQGMHTYILGTNKYADLNAEEWSQMTGLKFNGVQRAHQRRVRGVPQFGENVAKGLPSSVDWRKQGYVTDIKDQGQCGSCWAFSAVASTEGQHFKKTGSLVSLSEQNLVDCSGSQGNMGCNGGLMDYAFQYIIANKGIDTEASYPYHATDGQCAFKAANVGATLSSFADIPSGNETALETAIATVGPISVAIDASLQAFQLYRSGVYKPAGCSSTQLDHGVTAVGYGVTSTEQKYYIVKNSWGSTWGMEGYIWMAREAGNICGIATAASYPIV